MRGVANQSAIIGLLVLLALGCGGDSKGPPPSITSVSPSSGSDSGGTPVTISGAHFQDGAVVYFATVKVESLVNSTTSISVPGTPSYRPGGPILICPLCPCHPVGSASVLVLNPDLPTTTLETGFTYFNC